MGVTAVIGAAVLGAGANIAGGIAANSQAKTEAAQYEQNARLAKTAANQEEVIRREDLLSTLSSVRAIRTSRGLDPSSPTGQAIGERLTLQAERGIGAERLNALNQAQAYRTQAAITRSQGKTALLTGFLKAGTGLLGTFGGAGGGAGAGGAGGVTSVGYSDLPRYA